MHHSRIYMHIYTRCQSDNTLTRTNTPQMLLYSTYINSIATENIVLILGRAYISIWIVLCVLQLYTQIMYEVHLLYIYWTYKIHFRHKSLTLCIESFGISNTPKKHARNVCVYRPQARAHLRSPNKLSPLTNNHRCRRRWFFWQPS